MNSHPKIRIAPSILAADPGRLAEQAQEAEAAGADYIHVDVMDGHFVPNLTFGPAIVAALRKAVTIPLDVHLMIMRPDLYAQAFIDAGANILTVHQEASHDVSNTLKTIRQLGAKCGLAINPPTSAEKAVPFLPEIDLLLCMTVHPGFGGQAFIPETLDKVSFFRKLIHEKSLDCLIEVDGGVNAQTISAAASSGADVFVCGTSVYRGNVTDAVKDLRGLAESASSL
ncbi:ribulose-phosphate 3-epimerase [Kamptonema cortianum]|nr:ribulose-phosphate 3-epimerase [Kamptonema cortianum]MDL5050058.1 ribulose-phosphate 3-epimerase [Oscillatoria amoena NRMC-F 0135]